MIDISSKKIIIFDLDDTLAASKSVIEEEMSDLISGLLTKKKIAVIGGGSWKQFNEQLLGHLQCREDLLSNLYLFPTTATRFYRCHNGIWVEVYSDVLRPDERERIKLSFKKAFEESGYVQPEKVYGDIIEDRGTQITFSALGQKAPVFEKEKWKLENESLRQKIASIMRDLIPEFEVRTGGLTSVDITKKGINKAYGVRQIEKLLKIPINEMVFIGDALYPGGNDHAVIETGIETIAVKGPEDTKKVIIGWL